MVEMSGDGWNEVDEDDEDVTRTTRDVGRDGDGRDEDDDGRDEQKCDVVVMNDVGRDETRS